MKKNILSLITIAISVNSYADFCPRDVERLSRNQLFELTSMDKMLGSYQLSGNEHCKEMKITVEETCNPAESDYSLATSYYLMVEGSTQLTSYLRYYIQPESRPSKYMLTVGPRKITLSNRQGSGGGILTTYRKAILNFKKKKLKSVDIIETSGVFFQSVDFQTHCEVEQK